jgi:hypothetical protein
MSEHPVGSARLTSPFGMPQETAIMNAPDTPAPKWPLTPEAERALAEAAVRRAKAAEPAAAETAKEIGGRGGPEPTRYGDWEINGLASDF